MEDIVSMLATSAKAKNVELILEYTTDAPYEVIADSRAIRQIMTNLIGNALKFTERGHVRVRVRSLGIFSAMIHLRILVEDTGIGIPLEMQQMIFEQFQQVSPAYTRNTSQAGTGLGLTICKNLVKLMDSELEVTSELNQGSTFSFTLTLPLHLGEHGYKQQGGKEMTTNTEKPKVIKVLLVEDDPLIQLIHKRYLAQLHCDFVLAETGTKAVAFAMDKEFDVILMDVGIPEISGLDATKRIREHEKNYSHKSYIAGLTGYSDSESLEKCVRAGMDRVLVKPVGLDEFKRILTEFPEKIRAH